MLPSQIVIGTACAILWNFVFRLPFRFWISLSGEVRFSGSIDPINELPNLAGLCAAVLERGRPEFIAEHDPVAVLAVPIVGCTGRYVAVAPFAIAEADDGTIAKSLTSLGYRTEDALAWSSSPSVWNAKRLVHLAELQVEKWSADERMHRLHRENAELSSHLSATYEELSLLYGLTQKLKISASIEELGQKSLEWLAEAVAAEGLLLELLPHANSLDEAGSAPPRESMFLPLGDCPLDRFRFHRLIEHLNLDHETQPHLINSTKSDSFAWPERDIRQAVIVPLTEGENLFGWLAAFNHHQNREFGSSEANLLSSVATILGIHAATSSSTANRPISWPEWCGLLLPPSTPKILIPAVTAIAWPESPFGWPTKWA